MSTSHSDRWFALISQVLLSIAAVVSLALGLFQDFGTERPTFSCGNGQTCEQPPVDWVEGTVPLGGIRIMTYTVFQALL